MITNADIQRFLTDPEAADNADSAELRHLVQLYPYCEPLHWIYLRNLFSTGDVTFESELQHRSIYISNHEGLYYYVTYTRPDNQANALSDDQIIPPSVNYFDISQDASTQKTLQQLAERLRTARLARQAAPHTDSKNAASGTVTGTQPENTAETTVLPPSGTGQEKEIKIRQLIQNRKYSEALEILRSINLNNSKKSTYFALQIKYIETIINNQNKLD